MSSLYVSQQYVMSFVADWFHAFPHVDITFRQVNATFDPSNSEYLEALGILIAIPGFWLILTLLAFLIFFLCRCCDTNFKRKRKLTPYKWALAIFALLCCGALAVGLFGNNEAHGGIGNVQRATENVAEMVLTTKNETKTIERLLEAQVSADLQRLSSIFAEPLPNITIHSRLLEMMENMQSNVSVCIKKIKEVNGRVEHVDLRQIPVTIHLVELFRWPATIALLCLLILVCLLLLWGVIRHSRCMLILFSVLGLLSVVICWVLVSVYLGICVAGSDFCKDPEPFLYKQASGAIDITILNYYMHCSEHSVSPFSEALKEGSGAVDNMTNLLSLVTKIADEFYRKQQQVREMLDRVAQNLNDTERYMNGVTTLLECQAMHKEYITAMGATCYTILEGTAFMLASAAGSGLFFTVLIWIASHTWIHIRKKRPAEHVDEEDPFLPPSAPSANNPKRSRETYGSTGLRPRYSHTPPQTPHFPSSLNGRSNGREDHSFLQGRYTPPPAYDQLSGGSVFSSGASKTGFKPRQPDA